MERSVVLNGSPLGMPQWRPRLCATPGPTPAAPNINPPLAQPPVQPPAPNQVQPSRLLLLLLWTRHLAPVKPDAPRSRILLHRIRLPNPKDRPNTGYYQTELGPEPKPHRLRYQRPRLQRRRKTRSPQQPQRWTTQHPPWHKACGWGGQYWGNCYLGTALKPMRNQTWPASTA